MTRNQTMLFDTGEPIRQRPPFEVFWSWAQRKVNKGAARKRYEPAVRFVAEKEGFTPQEARMWLLTRWRRYNECEAARTGEHLHPATWLSLDGDKAEKFYDEDLSYPAFMENWRARQPVKTNGKSQQFVTTRQDHRRREIRKEYQEKLRGRPVEEILSETEAAFKREGV